MRPFTRYKFFLWYFGHFKVPLIGHLRPKLLSVDDEQIVVKLPLTRRSKNHLNSMYFGALAVGADIAGGLHGFYHAKKEGLRVSLAFKSFRAEFHRRPEADVYFVSTMGTTVQRMLNQSRESGARVNEFIDVTAFVDYFENPEEVASFSLELSLKVL